RKGTCTLSSQWPPQASRSGLRLAAGNRSAPSLPAVRRRYDVWPSNPLVQQFRDGGGYGGVELSPGIIRTLLEGQPDDLLRRGWESLSARGPLPLLVDLYETLIAAARRMAEVLALEDVIALEQRTALADMGQYVAHRQVLQIATRLGGGAPPHKGHTAGRT